MESKNKIFLDTDVVLDHLANRQPFAECAHRLFVLAERGEIIVCVASLSFSNLFYLLRKFSGRDGSLALLRQLKRLVRVIAVTDFEVQKALDSEFMDFEDALQYQSAKSESGIQAIVTRNEGDFSKSDLPVLSPNQCLHWLESARNTGSSSDRF